MDAVISIGGQSFVDGLVRILGPGLQALRAPMPIALPGLSNAVLSIRSIQSVIPSAQSGTIELDLEIDLTAEVLLVASVATDTVNLTLGNGTVTLPASSGSLSEPLRSGTLATDPGTGTETGTIAGVATTLNLALNSLSGSVTLPAATAPLTLNQIVGTIQLPAGVGNLALPLPAVVPVAVNFTRDAPLTARGFLSPLVNNAAAGAAVRISASSGFGLEFSFDAPNVRVDAIPATVVSALQTVLTTAFSSVAGQLLQGLTALTQPSTDLPAVVTNITNAIPAAVQSTLVNGFSGLRARTGRLIYPVPAAGSSSDVAALPTVAAARLVLPTGASPVLQVAFDRIAIPSPVTFPTFVPTGILDTAVTLSNAFVRDLLSSLIEKFPNLSLPTLPPTLTNAPALSGATWTGVTLTVGPLAFTGTMTLAITGTPAGPGATPVPKAITLTFALAAAIGAPLVPGPALTVGLTFTLPIAFDLNGLASITRLRLVAPAPIAAFTFGLGAGLIALLVIASFGILAAMFVGFVPVFWLGFVVIASLIVSVPIIVTGIVGGLLRNGINQVLGGLHRLLQSPAAVPQGIFEAFGPLVPTTMVVDDLVAGGVLQTPTSPWAVLPLRTREI